MPRSSAGLSIQVLSGLYPVTVTLVGGVPIPLELWLLVGVGAALAWALAETWSRLVWRTHRRQAKVLGSGQ